MSTELWENESEPETDPVRSTVAGAAFTALISVGAYISIPIGPVPIVLQNFFVFLAGLLLGPVRGLVSVAVYLLLGAVGLPVFAGGTGGLAHFFGPTGGFLLGFLPSVYVAGLASRILRKRKDDSNSSSKPRAGGRQFPMVLLCSLGLLFAAVAIYLVGVPWLKLTTDISWSKSIAVGVLPFIPGDIVKIAAAVFTAESLSPRFETFLGEG